MRLDVKTLVSVLIILLVSLSSTRVLDDYVDDYTNESIRNAALTYASARGINALVRCCKAPRSKRVCLSRDR